jgi:hypothetical protein
MRSDLHDNEFEQWLRQETDRHRLYADESVWARIQQRVHRRRWFPFVLTAFLTISASVTWVMIDQPDLPINYTAELGANPSNAQNDKTVQRRSSDRSHTSEKQTPFRIASETTDEPLAFLIRSVERTDVQSNKSVLTDLTTDSEKNTEQFFETANLNTSRTETRPSMPLQNKVEAPVLSQPKDHLATNSNTGNEPPSDPTASKKPSETVAVMAPEQFQTIESVINGYKGKRTRKSWKMQFSVSPTISYRQLIENTAALQAARSVTPAAPAMAVPELENVVNHKPDLGLQFGVSVSRQLTKRLDLIAGVQFNINNYDIRAYGGSREVATVGLSNAGGTGSVSSYTNYRSAGGVWAKWLANNYFSVSAPIGFQYRVTGNGKWSWGIGSTLQPTYLLSNQAYILSTDYKNYLEVPSLIRKWNLNGQVESFIGFKKGKTRWTLGPQVRYQILSSYEKAYPVREHLFDMGVKLGVGL